MLQDITIFMRETYNVAHLKGWAMKIVTFKGGKDFLGPFEMAPWGLRLFWPLKWHER
jgi:hypothetical protein